MSYIFLFSGAEPIIKANEQCDVNITSMKNNEILTVQKLNCQDSLR